MIQFAIQSFLILLFAFIIYRLLLKQEKAFRFNRFYLILTILGAILFPMFEFENTQVQEYLNSSEIIQQDIIPASKAAEGSIIKVSDYSIANSVPVETILWMIYGFISFILLIRFAKNIYALLKTINQHKAMQFGNSLILLEEDISPFSFFKFIFLNKKQFENQDISSDIIAHEAIHGKQLHSLDILFVELCLVLFWFNPVLWFMKNEISENHEYLADDALLKEGLNPKAYAEEILSAITRINQQALSCGFSFIQTKNRIKMLNKKNSPILKITSKITFASTLVAIALLISSYSYTELNSAIPNKKYTVVIDAGHGGKDNGATEGNLIEKEVTLAVVKQIRKLDKDKDLEIVYTRVEDKFVSLDDRFATADKVNANLYISLHVNSSKPNIRGLEIFLQEDSAAYERSKDAGTIMGLYLANKTGFEEFRIEQADYLMFKKLEIPAFYIELGFMTNENDAALLNQEDVIEKLANSIYSGLIDIKEGKSQVR